MVPRADIASWVWESKYRRSDVSGRRDRSIEDSWRRVATAVAAAEQHGQQQWADAFFSAMRELRFLPGGRIIAGAGTGDVLLFVAEKAKAANTCMGAIRLHIGDKLGLIRKGEWQFMWLTDPPLFEIDDATGEVAAAHHPFTSPREEDEDKLERSPGDVLARAYDLVLNGVEVGGGSIRIHRSDLQARAFKALGITDEEAQQKFGFLLEAFKFGPPPHGGIAFGLDRLSMLMSGAESLREVITFPKTQKGTDLMTECPTPVSKKQLEELFIQVRPDLPTK